MVGANSVTVLVNGFSVTSFRSFLKTPYLLYSGGR